MKKPNVLMLDGKPFEIRPLTPTVMKVRAFLEKLPENELLTTRELARRAGVSYEHVTAHLGTEEPLLRFRVGVRYPRRMTVWGNAKTIAEFSKNKELLA